MKLDSVYCNVHDFDAALERVRSQLGLKPFLCFELVEGSGATPIALISLGEHTLELLGTARGERPAGAVIQRVEIGLPVAGPLKVEIEPGVELDVHPSAKRCVRVIKVATPDPRGDSRVFTELLGAGGTSMGAALDLGGVRVEMVEVEKQGPVPQTLPDMAFPGWHRLSLQVTSARESYRRLVENGLRSLVEPMTVLPGLDEAMLATSSGLIVQVAEQHLGKMLPVLALRLAGRAVTRRPVRFRARQSRGRVA